MRKVLHKGSIEGRNWERSEDGKGCQVLMGGHADYVTSTMQGRESEKERLGTGRSSPSQKGEELGLGLTSSREAKQV